MIEERKKELKFLLEFSQIISRIYKNNPSTTIKGVIIDTYKLIKATKIYPQEEHTLEDINNLLKN